MGQWGGTDTWDKLCTMGHMGVPRTVPSCPMWDSGTGRHLCTMGHMGVPRTVPSCPMWDSGTGRTLGTSYVRWDTWESLGLSRPVPCGTVGRDGHLCTMGHMGVPRTVPSCPMWDNGTGRTLGTSYVRWDTWESLGLSRPVPCGTVGRDGHLGQAMYDGTHGSP